MLGTLKPTGWIEANTAEITKQADYTVFIAILIQTRECSQGGVVVLFLIHTEHGRHVKVYVVA